MLYQGQPNELLNALFSDCHWLMEHLKTSMAETLILPIDFIKDYQDTPMFNEVKERMKNEVEYKTALIKSIHNVAAMLARR